MDEIRAENPKAVICREDYRTFGRKELKTLIDAAEDYEEMPGGHPKPALPAERVFSSVAVEEVSELDVYKRQGYERIADERDDDG